MPVSADESWVALARLVRDRLMQAKVHEALPLRALWRHIGRNLGTMGDTRISFDSLRTSGPPASAALEPFVVPGGLRFMDLDIRLRYGGGGLTLQATFDGSRYSEGGVASLLASVCGLLSRGIEDRAALVAALGAVVR